MKLKKVIIWGYPLYSHTQSFIHYGWYKAFKSLGYETYWFHDQDFPADFDFSNCLFIAEGYADKNIPINSSSVYYVHICINPEKYIVSGARLIDMRYNIKFMDDFSYDYTMHKDQLEKLGELCYYQKTASDLELKAKYRKGISGYEAIYISWATDLLPEEIDFDFVNIPKENKIYNVGSVWSANFRELNQFSQECAANGIEVVFRDPWKQVTTFEENKRLIQISYMAPDIRGSGAISDESDITKSAHLYTGYIPCRIFKNISYGQLGITNSWSVNDLFGGAIVYDSDIKNLFYKAQDQRSNKSLVLEQMSYVKTNHTYLNRVAAILSIL